MNNEYPIERNNYLKQEIMPKRKGSGPAGTKELLGVMGAVPAAAMAASPIGRGLMGIAGSMAANTSDSEAGKFTPIFSSSLFRNNGKPTKSGSRIFKQKIHLNDGSRLSGMTGPHTFYGYEKNGTEFTISTDSMAKRLGTIVEDTKAGTQLIEEYMRTLKVNK